MWDTSIAALLVYLCAVLDLTCISNSVKDEWTITSSADISFINAAEYFWDASGLTV